MGHPQGTQGGEFVVALDATLNAEAFDQDGYFRTGDLGYFDDDGYLHVAGRLKDVINRKGENISAKEVEDELYHHPDCSGALPPHPKAKANARA